MRRALLPLASFREDSFSLAFHWLRSAKITRPILRRGGFQTRRITISRGWSPIPSMAWLRSGKCMLRPHGEERALGARLEPHTHIYNCQTANAPPAVASGAVVAVFELLVPSLPRGERCAMRRGWRGGEPPWIRSCVSLR